MKTFPDWFKGQKAGILSISPLQIDYWACIELIIPPKTGKRLAVEKGFTKELEWIPKGYRFCFTFVDFSWNSNCLCLCAIEYEEKIKPGVYITKGLKYGYGFTEFPLGTLGILGEETRPWYLVYNFSDSEIRVFANIYGMWEKIKE